MCQAFSCIVGRDKKVWWEFGTDSHEDMIRKAGYQDTTINPKKIQFARIEISPKNKDYLNPDKWIFKINMDLRPAWWTEDHEKKCWIAFQKWKKKLDAVLPPGQKIIHPFRDVPPVTKVTKEQLKMLKDWDSVRDSVWASVWDSVWASVWASVWDSVWDSVRASVGASVGASVRDSVWASVGASVGASVRASVGASVRDSVWYSVWASVGASVRAYIGSFFRHSLNDWKYTEKTLGNKYSFQPAVDLWLQGLVPSFDGKIWRLHTGPDGHVVWKGMLTNLDGVGTPRRSE